MNDSNVNCQECLWRNLFAKMATMLRMYIITDNLICNWNPNRYWVVTRPTIDCLIHFIWKIVNLMYSLTFKTIVHVVKSIFLRFDIVPWFVPISMLRFIVSISDFLYIFFSPFLFSIIASKQNKRIALARPIP